MKYFFGVYIDYTYDKPVKKNDPIISRQRSVRVAQLCLTVDDLSCEMLADPGCITFYENSRIDAKEHGKQLALRYGCDLIEFGWGSYQLIKIKETL